MRVQLSNGACATVLIFALALFTTAESRCIHGHFKGLKASTRNISVTHAANGVATSSRQNPLECSDPPAQGHPMIKGFFMFTPQVLDVRLRGGIWVGFGYWSQCCVDRPGDKLA